MIKNRLLESYKNPLKEIKRAYEIEKQRLRLSRKYVPVLHPQDAFLGFGRMSDYVEEYSQLEISKLRRGNSVNGKKLFYQFIGKVLGNLQLKEIAFTQGELDEFDRRVANLTGEER
ncbi:MAG: hypothetical protein ACOCUU_03360 [Nanoarchaeota archaeon]